MLVVGGGAVNVTHVKFLDHAHLAYSMLLGKSLLIVAMKKRTVSQAEYALQLLMKFHMTQAKSIFL